MKLKKLFIPLILFMMFVPTMIFAAASQTGTTCNDELITIESVALEEKTDNVDEVNPPTITGKRINLDLVMNAPGDTIQYKIVVNNNSNEDYAFGNNLNNSSSYITYTYTSSEQGNIVPAGTSKTLYLTVRYQNEVPASSFVNGTFVDNKDLEINLSTDTEAANNNTNTNTTTDNAKDTVKNPKTGADASLLFIIVTLFVSGLLYVMFNKSKAIKHLVIIGGLLLIVPLSIYAATVCTCTLNVESKVTIVYVDPTVSVNTIKNHVVTTGDGLYVDSNTTDRYVFRGQNPPNYLRLNGENYRIISVEPDNTLKIIRTESIGTIPFDPGYTNEIPGVTELNSLPGTRYGISGDLCYVGTSNSYNGCKAWGSSSTTLKKVNGNITNISTFPKINNSDPFNLPADDAYLNVYLNGGTYKGISITGWYNSINVGTRTLIVEHIFNIGAIEHSENQTVATDINQEKEYLYRGMIGLISASDYVLASTNSSCKGVYDYASDSSCFNNSANHNYLAVDGEKEWTITPVSVSNISRVWAIDTTNNLDNASNVNSLYQVRPVFYVNVNNSVIEGNGTYNNPYSITILRN